MTAPQNKIKARSGQPVLSIENHHVAPAPDLTTTPDNAYVSYFMNELNEQMIFVRERGAEEATLYMGDNDWRHVVIRAKTDEELKTFVTGVMEASGTKATPAAVRKWVARLDPIMPHDVMLSEVEKKWLSLCWSTSSVMADYIRDKAVQV